MKCPEVYLYEDDDINAWATGTSASNAAIGITRAALERLSRDQIRAVIGHELGHIAAADIRRMQFALGFQNALVWFFGFRSWRWNAQHIFGFVGQLGIMGLSRRREYWADAIGAVLTSPETMKSALLAVQRDGQRPKRRRKYYNQLLFSWPGGNLLASHPTMQQRCAALDEGAFEASALRKMGATSSRLPKPLQNPASTLKETWYRFPKPTTAWWSENGLDAALGVLAPVLLVSGAWYVWELAKAPPPAIIVQQPAKPAEPIVTASVKPAPAPAPRVAAWSATAEPSPASPSAAAELEFEPPGYRCFKALDSRMPAGVTREFDERKDWSVYSASSVAAEKPLQQIPATLRECLRRSGARLEPKASAVENRKIEVWAYANETTCWFTPAVARAGSGPLSVLGNCHSPED
jgi:hypothetical protein